MFYLGNFRIDNSIQDDVETAAKAVKRDIKFLLEPMPITNPKIVPEEKYTIGFGTIAVYDGKKDCSKFWSEFLKNRQENP